MLCKKNTVWIFYLVCLSIGLSQAEDEDKTKFREVEDTNKSNKIQASTKPSVESRFFDLGGVINQLFPGFNQGGATGGNPGLNLPSNSQFYPGVPAQNNNPLTPINQGNGWYPNQQNVERPTFQNQMLPSESNFNQRGSINNINQPGQYLNQGGVGQYPADLNGNLINGNQFGQGGNPQYSNVQPGQPQLGVNQGQGFSNFDPNNSFLNQNGQLTNPNLNQGGNSPSTNGQFGNGFNNAQGQTLSPGQFNGQNLGLPHDQNIVNQNANGAQSNDNFAQAGSPDGQYAQNPNQGVVNGGQINTDNQNSPGQWNQKLAGNNNRIPSNQGLSLQNQYPNEQNLGNGFNNPANGGTVSSQGLQNQYPNEQNLGNGFKNPTNGGTGFNQGLQNQYPNEQTLGNSFNNLANEGLNQGIQGTDLNNIGQAIKNPSQLNTNVSDASWPTSENRPEDGQIPNYSLSQGQPPLSSDNSWSSSPSGSNKKPLYTGQKKSNNRGSQNSMPNQGTHNDFLTTSDSHSNPGHGDGGFGSAINFPEDDDEYDDDEDDDEKGDDIYKKKARESSKKTPSTPLIQTIFGKSVSIPTSTVSSDQMSFIKSDDITAAQKLCVQNCPTSTEYKPVCGTDNVSYFNGERLVCARNCGIKVFEARDGSCRIDN